MTLLAESAKQPVGNHPCVDALDHMEAWRALAEPADRGELFRTMPFDQFEQLTLGFVWLAAGAKEDAWGYAPRNQRIFQVGDPGAFAKDMRTQITHNGVAPQHRRPLAHQIFETAQDIPDMEAALIMWGLATRAAHPYRDGHKRLTRTVYSVFGDRGYDGSPGDREHYNKLLDGQVGKRMHVLAPRQAGLAQRFALHAANVALSDLLGYDGPLVVGAKGGDMLATFNQLPELPTTKERRIAAALASERDFNLVTLANVAGFLRLDPDYFLTRDPAVEPRIDVGRVISHIHGRDGIGLLEMSHDVYKYRFVQAIMDCLAKGDTTYFDAAELVAQYRPKRDGTLPPRLTGGSSIRPQTVAV